MYKKLILGIISVLHIGLPMYAAQASSAHSSSSSLRKRTGEDVSGEDALKNFQRPPESSNNNTGPSQSMEIETPRAEDSGNASSSSSNISQIDASSSSSSITATNPYEGLPPFMVEALKNADKNTKKRTLILETTGLVEDLYPIIMDYELGANDIKFALEVINRELSEKLPGYELFASGYIFRHSPPMNLCHSREDDEVPDRIFAEAFTFSPDGTNIAILTSSHLEIYDLKTNRLLLKTETPDRFGNGMDYYSYRPNLRYSDDGSLIYIEDIRFYGHYLDGEERYIVQRFDLTSKKFEEITFKEYSDLEDLFKKLRTFNFYSRDRDQMTVKKIDVERLELIDNKSKKQLAVLNSQDAYRCYPDEKGATSVDRWGMSPDGTKLVAQISYKILAGFEDANIGSYVRIWDIVSRNPRPLTHYEIVLIAKYLSEKKLSIA